MRFFNLLAFIIITSLSLQFTPENVKDGDEIYLNSFFERVNKKKHASYTGDLVNQSEKGFHYKIYFLSGELKMEGWYKDQEMEQPHGEFSYYYKSGQLESKGVFRDGAKYGLWERYAANGKEKPEKIYASKQMLEALEE